MSLPSQLTTGLPPGLIERIIQGDISSSPDQLLTTPEAAAHFKVKPSTLEKWRCQKSQPLPFLKIGRAVRYRRSDLETFLKNQTQES